MVKEIDVDFYDQQLIFSMAKDIFVEEAKHPREDAQEFVAKCYMKAIERFLNNKGCPINLNFKQKGRF